MTYYEFWFALCGDYSSHDYVMDIGLTNLIYLAITSGMDYLLEQRQQAVPPEAHAAYIS